MSNKIGCMLCRLAKAWQPAQKQLLRIASLFVCVFLLFSFMPIDSFAAEAQQNLVYNGYEYPPPPEGVTDYVISNASYANVTSFVILYKVSSFTCYYSNEVLYLDYESSYKFLNGTWVLSNSSGGSVNISSSPFVFSTQDIYYQGTDDFYFHGSEPLSIADATMYSYNGFIAPSVFFNTWFDYDDHLLIYRDPESNDIFCANSAYPIYFTRNDNGGWDSHRSLAVNPYYNAYLYKFVNGNWVVYERLPHGLTLSFPNLSYFIWASEDITYLSSGNLIFEGTEAIPVGFETNVFNIVAQDDDYSLELGQSSLLQLYNPRGQSANGDWTISGNTSTNTSIIENSPDENGLAISATLQIGEDETAKRIVVYCSFINSQNRFTTKSFSIDIEPPSDASYSIIQTGNPFPEFVPGQVYYFQVIDVHDSTPTLLPAEWSISGENIDERTTISSGVLTISGLQQPTTITITASNIDYSGKSATYVLNTVSSGFDDGEGDSGSDATNQDVVDSVNNGFTDLGNKIETGLENLGNNIVTNIIDALFRFFVPTAEELTAQMNSFVDWINTNYPILGVPMEFVSYTYDLFFGVTPELAVLKFPQISVMDNVIIQETTLDFKQYEWLETILPIIRTTLTMAACYAFGHWAIRKVKEISHI